MAELFLTVAELKLQVGMEKAPHAEEKTSWKTQIEESRKVRVGEGLEQVEGVKWNVWRNFLIAAAAVVGIWKRVVNHALKWFNRSEMKYAAW